MPVNERAAKTKGLQQRTLAGERLVNFEYVLPPWPTILASNNSALFFQLLTFPTNRGICFSLEAVQNGMKTLDSGTVRDTWRACFWGLRLGKSILLRSVLRGAVFAVSMVLRSGIHGAAVILVTR